MLPDERWDTVACARDPDGDVLVVSPTFYPEAIGTPHYVTDLVRELVRQGQAPRVLTGMPYYPAFKRFDGYDRSRRRDWLGSTPLHRVPTIVPRRGAPLWRAISEANFLLQSIAVRLVGRVSPAARLIAVSPGVPLAVLAALCFRRRGGRSVVIVHDVAFGLAQATAGFGVRLGGILRRLEVYALNRADVVAALSPEMAAALVGAGVTTTVEVMPLWPTVRPPRFAALPSAPVVLYSGNLGRKQGVDRLLDLADRLRSQVPMATLVIRGQGSERPALEVAAARRGLRNVEFCGFVPEKDLGAALSRAHVHVVPQLPEGAPFAVPSKIVNILAVGRPVVVTAATGSPLERLSGEVSAIRCVDPDDPQAFADEVVRLLDDAEWCHELGEAARGWINAGHSREAAIERLLALLASPALR